MGMAAAAAFLRDVATVVSFNELSFEDEKGRQEIYMHAQRGNFTPV